MRKTWLALIVVTALSWAARAQQPATAADASKAVAQALEDILREAHRQERVSGEMSGMLLDFQKLVADLESNGLLPEAKGEDLITMAKTIDATDREKVRVAAQRLRDASGNDAERGGHIDAAETAIQGALEQLRALLSEANALRAGEMVGNELREIIRQEERINQMTTTIGTEMLAGMENLSHQPKVLAEEQGRIGERAAGLEELMGQALQEDMAVDARERLEKALEIMQEERVRGRLAVAAHSIEQGDPMTGVTEQNKALEALRAMLDALSIEKRDNKLLVDARKEISNILTNQAKLREAVDSKTPEQFKKDSPELQMKQRELRKQLEKALAAMREAQAKKDAAKKDDLAKKDGKAQDGADKKKHGEGTVKGKPKTEVKAPAEQSKMQGESPSGTGKASKNNAPQKNKPKEGGSDPGEKPGQAAEKPMAVAEDELAKQQQQQATEAQREAEKMLAQVLKDLDKQMLAQQFPEMTPEQLDNMMDLQAQVNEMQQANDPSMEEALKQAMAMLAEAQKEGTPTPSDKPGPPTPGKPRPPKQVEKGKPGKIQMGPRPFARMSVAGQLPESKTSTWESLSREERDALGENFARELPREYRPMLQAYYEKLSKE
jgi:hypothetical protein